LFVVHYNVQVTLDPLYITMHIHDLLHGNNL